MNTSRTLYVCATLASVVTLSELEIGSQSGFSSLPGAQGARIVVLPAAAVVETADSAHVATEDGSEEADESDEVCSSFPHKKKNGLATNDIGHRIYHGTRKPEP